MANLYNVPLQNSIQRVLANTLDAGETSTITFSVSVSSVLQASADIPGILVIDRIDSNGNLTPTNVEYISFTGVSGSTVTGLTRGLAGTTAKGHSIGAVVEFVPDVTWADALNDVITTQHNADGTHKTISLISLTSVTLNYATLNNTIFSGNSLVSVNIGSSVFENGTIANTSLVSTTFVNRTYIPVEQKLIASTASTNIDWSISNIHSYVLASGTTTTTLTFSNPLPGQAIILRLAQGDSNRLVSFPSTIYWSGGVIPTLTTTAYKWDVFGFLCRASGYYDGYIVGMNLQAN